MEFTLAAPGGRRFSIPDRSGHLFRHAQGRAADHNTDIGDAE
jgi:hypothetical protein